MFGFTIIRKSTIRELLDRNLQLLESNIRLNDQLNNHLAEAFRPFYVTDEEEDANAL